MMRWRRVSFAKMAIAVIEDAQRKGGCVYVTMRDGVVKISPVFDLTSADCMVGTYDETAKPEDVLHDLMSAAWTEVRKPGEAA